MSRLLIHIIFFSISTLTFSQSIDKSEVVGLYGLCDNGYFVCKQIHLKHDSTFIYAQFYDVGGWQTHSGYWTLKEKGIIRLNSKDTYQYPKNSVVEKEIIGQNYTTIRVQMINRPLGKAKIKVNNDSVYFLGDLFGEIEIPSFDMQKISIEKIFDWTDIGLEKYDFEIKNPKSNDITIIASPYNMYHLMDYFDNHELRIKNNKLYYWHKPNGRFDRKRFLLKTGIENLQYE